MKTGIYQTTKNGFEKLVNELKYREKELRKQIADTLSEMRNQGDLSENDGYSLAVEEQFINEQKILDLKERIKNTKIIKKSNRNKVALGHTVTLKNNTTVKYQITSEEEANPLEGKISHESPIAKAILGKKIGDKVKIVTPKGTTNYIIQKIS